MIQCPPKLNLILGAILSFSIGVSANPAISSMNNSATVARVANYVITSREVQLSSVMDHWFLLTKKNEKSGEKTSLKPANEHKDWLLDINSSAFQKQLNIVMAEYLVMSEAENFSVAQLAPSEVQKFSKQLSDDMKGWSEWSNMEVSLVELESSVSRHLRAQEFIKFKTESMGIQVSDDEAKKYYDQNKGRFNNLAFEGFKDSIKEFLINRDIESKMKDWFEVLRKKYKVKILQIESGK